MLFLKTLPECFIWGAGDMHAELSQAMMWLMQAQLPEKSHPTGSATLHPWQGRSMKTSQKLRSWRSCMGRHEHLMTMRYMWSAKFEYMQTDLDVRAHVE